jgi:magnesium chelatase accessory protein
MDWARDGGDWPNRDASRFVDAAGLRWHVQVSGRGPPVLLLHGTGASTHSWRDLAPRLAAHFQVVAPDLPGHAFSGALPRPPTLPAMSRALGALLDELALRPALAAGHSAGAAILVRMTSDRLLSVPAIVSLNGALLPLAGVTRAFSPAAWLLAHLPFVPRLAAWRAQDPRAVDRLIESTGSRLDPRGRALYARLMCDPAHVAGALAMMAHWDLESLQPRLEQLEARTLLVVGSNDRTVPPQQAETLAPRLQDARIVTLPGLGHLAHEEDPHSVEQLLVAEARRWGVLSPG